MWFLKRLCFSHWSSMFGSLYNLSAFSTLRSRCRQLYVIDPSRSGEIGPWRSLEMPTPPIIAFNFSGMLWTSNVDAETIRPSQLQDVRYLLVWVFRVCPLEYCRCIFSRWTASNVFKLQIWHHILPISKKISGSWAKREVAPAGAHEPSFRLGLFCRQDYYGVLRISYVRFGLGAFLIRYRKVSFDQGSCNFTFGEPKEHLRRQWRLYDLHCALAHYPSSCGGGVPLVSIINDFFGSIMAVSYHVACADLIEWRLWS